MIAGLSFIAILTANRPIICYVERHGTKTDTYSYTSCPILPPFSEIEVCRQAQEATREAERRRQMVVVGDMQPLAAALPKLTPTTATQIQTG